MRFFGLLFLLVRSLAKIWLMILEHQMWVSPNKSVFTGLHWPYIDSNSHSSNLKKFLAHFLESNSIQEKIKDV